MPYCKNMINDVSEIFVMVNNLSAMGEKEEESELIDLLERMRNLYGFGVLRQKEVMDIIKYKSMGEWEDTYTREIEFMLGMMQDMERAVRKGDCQ